MLAIDLCSLVRRRGSGHINRFDEELGSLNDRQNRMTFGQVGSGEMNICAVIFLMNIATVIFLVQ
jgi:hypothetical protein